MPTRDQRPSLKNVPLGSPRTLDEFVGGAAAAQPAPEPVLSDPPPRNPDARVHEAALRDSGRSRRAEPRTKVTFTLPANLHTQLKQLAIMTGERMEDIAAQAIRERIDRTVDAMPGPKRTAFRGMTED